MGKFDNVPVEQDTKIIAGVEATLGEYDILYQKWVWDGIEAESIIFVADEVASMSGEAIKDYVSDSPLVKDKEGMTMMRDSKGFTFVNFNFVTL